MDGKIEGGWDEAGFEDVDDDELKENIDLADDGDLFGLKSHLY